MTELQTAELFEACGILFGPQISVSLDFLNYLQPSGLRAAYRKRALETHPDRANALGRDPANLAEKFRKAKIAYDRLNAYVEGEVIIRPTQNYKKPKPKPGFSKPAAGKDPAGNQSKEYFYSGQIPRRKLLLGQFLYYSGCISWKTFITAIVWQRRQRPALGRIAMQWGMLTDDEIQHILKSRQQLEKFGQSALRRGYLNRFELMALLGKQRRMQRPIGQYFIEQGDLTLLQLKQMLLHQKQHNDQIPLPSGFGRI